MHESFRKKMINNVNLDIKNIPQRSHEKTETNNKNLKGCIAAMCDQEIQANYKFQ